MKILIVGSGIAGLGLAVALERRGIVADVIERQPSAPPFGACLYMPGNTARALRSLGIFEAVEPLAHRIQRQELFASNGQLLSTVEVGRFWSDVAPCLSIERNTLRGILEAALRDARIRYGWDIERIEHHQDQVRARFMNGTHELYDLIVGADGVDSKVRSQMFPGSKARFCGQICWRAIVDNPTSFADWHAMLGRDKALLAVGLPGSKLYLYADVRSGGDEGAELAPAEIFRDFSPPFAVCVEALANAEHGYRSRIEEVILEEWHRPNLVLIGDAAHASRPNMAEGAGMALEDALALAEMLADSRRLSLERLLPSFVERRRRRADWVQKQSQARDRLRSLPGFIRETVLRFGAARLHDRAFTPLRAEI